MNDEIRILASYVSYKELYDDGRKDVYQVISQFIENLLKIKGLRKFSIAELSNKMESHFGFNIPDYVIKSSIKRLSYVKRENNIYWTDFSHFNESSDIVSKHIDNAYFNHEKIIHNLIDYVNEKNGSLTDDDEKDLIKGFCSFLLDENSNNKFSKYISAYIIENNNNLDFRSQLEKTKHGVILFAGLNYSIDISDKSAWNDEVTVYIENEILFHLAGYNGLLFKKLSEELFSLIREMNNKAKKKIIKLYVFKDTLEEIDMFFSTAENIVKTGDIADIENDAMNEIVNGCKSISDVVEKKSNFYSILKKYSIKEYDNIGHFYDKENFEYNLDCSEYIEAYQIDEKHRYIKHLSFINILRKGIHSEDFRRCKHVVLTETGKILKISSDFNNNSGRIPLAVDMNFLTNKLWFDLNKGFGANEFPSTFDVFIKSQIVLSKLLKDNISDKFEQVKTRFSKKEITKEQLFDKIDFLRSSAIKPEEIENNKVDALLDFISEKDLKDYQSEKEALKTKLENYQEKYSNVVEENKLKDTVIDKKEEEKNKIQREHEELVNDSIDSIEKQKEKADRKIQRILKICKVCIYAFFMLLYFVIFYVFIIANNSLKTLMGFVATIIPFVSPIYSIFVEKKFDFLILYKRFINYIKIIYTKKIYLEYSVDINRLNELKKSINKKANI